MISVGAVIYIFVRALPRVELGSQSEKKNILERWIASEIPDRVDAALNGFTVKFLRKLKVLLLKVDNTLSGHLQKIKPEAASANGNGKPKPVIDFKEIAAEKNGVAEQGGEKTVASGEDLSNNQL